MKARLRGTPCEVEVVPYFPEGMFAGFTDVSGTLQPGMVVYKSSDLEFLETPPKLKPEVDWDAFRREAAKDVMCAVLSTPGMWTDTTYDGLAAACIKQAEELIEQLKQAENATEKSEKSMVQRKV